MNLGQIAILLVVSWTTCGNNEDRPKESVVPQDGSGDCSWTTFTRREDLDSLEEIGTPVRGEGFDGVILLPEGEEKALAEEEVHQFESKLPSYVSQSQIRLEWPLHEYKRHYMVAAVEGHRRLIVLFFHHTTGYVTSSAWLKVRMFSYGGGHCFLRSRYNLDTGEVEELWVNAPA